MIVQEKMREKTLTVAIQAPKFRPAKGGSFSRTSLQLRGFLFLAVVVVEWYPTGAVGALRPSKDDQSKPIADIFSHFFFVSNSHNRDSKNGSPLADSSDKRTRSRSGRNPWLSKSPALFHRINNRRNGILPKGSSRERLALPELGLGIRHVSASKSKDCICGAQGIKQ